MAEDVLEEFAMLIVDGKPRLMCADCSKRAETLSILKMLRRVDIGIGATAVLYEIVAPHTLEDCRRISREAHEGAN